MIHNLNEIKNDPFKDQIYDVCIVGTGFAGIALALKLHENLNVLLLEAGDMDYSTESQEVYKGKNIGHEYYDLTDCRTRCFGGTSNVWGGVCGTLDALDFEKKDFMDFSGWPIKKDDLDPYIEEAKQMFGLNDIGQSEEFVKGWDDILMKPDKYFDGFEIMHSKQAYFKNTHSKTVKERSNIHCYINANLTDMTQTDNLESIKVAEIQNYRKKVFNAKAKIFILATGGIENSRLLLNFNRQCKNGIGNNNGLVGRFFSEHPHFTLGEFIIEDHVFEASKSGKLSEMKYLAPSNKFQIEDKILNFGLELHTKDFIKHSILRDSSPFKERLRAIICSMDWTKYIASKINGKDIFCVSETFDQSDGILNIEAEQVPNLSSRVILGSDIDKFGMRQVALEWKFLEIDKYTIKRAALRFAETFAELNLGRVKIEKWVLSDDPSDFPGFPHRLGGPHHMCTTRMSLTPKDGVVDLNQKVFDIDNLYIAGSSVFSTGGRINPTFSIVQMSLRLADHLNHKFDYKQA